MNFKIMLWGKRVTKGHILSNSVDTIATISNSLDIKVFRSRDRREWGVTASENRAALLDWWKHLEINVLLMVGKFCEYQNLHLLSWFLLFWYGLVMCLWLVWNLWQTSCLSLPLLESWTLGVDKIPSLFIPEILVWWFPCALNPPDVSTMCTWQKSKLNEGDIHTIFRFLYSPDLSCFYFSISSAVQLLVTRSLVLNLKQIHIPPLSVMTGILEEQRTVISLSTPHFAKKIPV